VWWRLVGGKRLFCENLACLSAIIALAHLDAAVGLRVPSFICSACVVCCERPCASPSDRTDRHSVSFVPSPQGFAQVDKSDIVQAYVPTANLGQYELPVTSDAVEQ
jgi:hypothetical protein